MPNSILLDTGFIYALFNRMDKHHASAINFAARNRLVSIVPNVTLPEVCFLFRRDFKRHNVIIKFLEEFSKAGVTLEPVTMPDVKRAHEIMAKYADAELDFVDCAVMALAERLNITQICTFDRRDFGIVRPTHCETLDLLP